MCGLAKFGKAHRQRDRKMGQSGEIGGPQARRIQKLYPDLPGHEIEEVLLNWIDMGYNPENYSQGATQRA